MQVNGVGNTNHWRIPSHPPHNPLIQGNTFLPGTPFIRQPSSSRHKLLQKVCGCRSVAIKHKAPLAQQTVLPIFAPTRQKGSLRTSRPNIPTNNMGPLQRYGSSRVRGEKRQGRIPVRAEGPKLTPREPNASSLTAGTKLRKDDREIPKARAIMLHIIRISNTGNASTRRSTVRGRAGFPQTKNWVLGRTRQRRRGHSTLWTTACHWNWVGRAYAG